MSFICRCQDCVKTQTQRKQSAHDDCPVENCECLPPADIAWDWSNLQQQGTPNGITFVKAPQECFDQLKVIDFSNRLSRWTVERLREALYGLPENAEILIQPNPGGEELAEFVSGMSVKVWVNDKGETVFVVYIEGEE